VKYTISSHGTFISVFEASRITVNGSNHSDIGCLVSLDITVILPMISGFLAINFISIISSSIPLVISDVAILREYVHSSGISNSYTSSSFNNVDSSKDTTFLVVLLDGVIDLI
jgi:hypothetical protein